jgi:hypothetical protein
MEELKEPIKEYDLGDPDEDAHLIDNDAFPEANMPEGDIDIDTPEGYKKFLEANMSDGEKKFLGDLINREGKTAGPDELKAKSPPTAKDYWDKFASDQDRIDLVNDFVGTRGDELGESIGREMTENFGKDFDKLSQEFKDHVDKVVRELYGEPEVDLGRTVHEPSADERFARDRVPDDVRSELMDIIIDSETQHWDNQKTIAKLTDFAARHEVTMDQVDQTLKDMGLAGADTNLDKGKPAGAWNSIAKEAKMDIWIRTFDDYDEAKVARNVDRLFEDYTPEQQAALRATMDEDLRGLDDLDH